MNRAFTRLAASAGTLVIAATMTVVATTASAQEATIDPSSPTWRANRGNTPGYAMMTREERNQHHQMMMGMKDHATCQSYMQEHHAKMMERAKERKQAVPAMPRRDACGWLKK
jgi:hypothetical protein